jgi:hypothetical protein
MPRRRYFTAYKLAAAELAAAAPGTMGACALVTLAVPFDRHVREYSGYERTRDGAARVQPSHLMMSSSSCYIRVKSIERVDVECAGVSAIEPMAFIDTAYSLTYPGQFVYKTGEIVSPDQEACPYVSIPPGGHRIFFYLSRHAALFGPSHVYFKNIDPTHFPKPLASAPHVAFNFRTDGYMSRHVPIHDVVTGERDREWPEAVRGLTRTLYNTLADAAYQKPYRQIIDRLPLFMRAPSTRMRRVPKRLMYT